MKKFLGKTEFLKSLLMGGLFTLGLMLLPEDAMAQALSASSLLSSGDSLLKAIGVLGGIYVLISDLIVPLVKDGKIHDSFGVLFIKFVVCLLLASGTLPSILSGLIGR